MEGFLRLMWGPAVGLIICWVLALIVAAYLSRNNAMDKKAVVMIKRIRNFVLVAATLLFLLYAFHAASVNLTPRSVIDRSAVQKQVQDFEKRNQPKQKE